MLQYFLNDISVLYTGDDLHFPAAPLTLLYIALNNRLDKFRDRRVREALTLAMDFEWQNRTLYFGYHKRAHSYWPDTIFTATGLPGEDELQLLEPYREQLPPELFERPFRFPEVTSPEDHRANMVKGRQLLAAAGWHVVDGVLKNARGEPFEIEFLSQNSEDARILLPYFQQLERLGIHGTIRLADRSQFVNRRREHDFDAILKGQSTPMPPVILLKTMYHSETAYQPVSENVAGISHPTVDYLVEQANLATTLAQMVASCRAIDRVLLWQYYQILLYAVDLPRTVHWDKFGRPAFESKYWPAFPDGWWYEPEKAARITGGGGSLVSSRK